MRYLVTHGFSRHCTPAEVVQGIYDADDKRQARKKSQREIMEAVLDSRFDRDKRPKLPRIPKIYRLRNFKAYTLAEGE